MALTRWPSEPPAWLEPWTIWKLRAETGPRPPTAPTKIPQYGWEFLTWVLWRRKNRPPPRPDIIADIPQWAYPVLKRIMIAVPLVPPPPPPPPPNPIPASSWGLPGPVLFTAWGWLNDSRWRDTNEGLADAARAGVRTILLQGGMFGADVPRRCRDYIEHVGVWGEAGSRDDQYLALAEAEAYVPQIEGIYQYQNAIGNLRRGVGAGLSLSTVTTLAGLESFTTRPDGTQDGEPTTVEVEELVNAGLTHAMVECYTGNMVPLDVGDFMASAERRGIYHAIPTAGLAGREGITLGTYSPDLDRYGRQIGVYLAEPLRPVDWQAIRAL